ncbi:GntR family transcriptional regulator [Kitasatospora sp. NPDC048365]|uniref:GntR family transcriptional regulator n=1 Tax=Kitasatospora sp. NPDC048365 TaxID=3364050 RepID=UPI00371421F9
MVGSGLFGSSASRSGDGRSAIRRNSLREQIADALREELMAGRFPAGRNFTVKEIADLYGVSATPAREALVDLAAQGLLAAEHHRGFTVPSFDWDDFLEIFEARTLLTDNALRHLSGRIGRYDWARLSSLRRRADAAVRASRSGQLDVLVGCDLRFWQEAAALLCNDRIAGYLGWLRVQSWMFAAPHLRAAGDLSGVCWDRHGELVDRIEDRDQAGAHRIINDYNLFTVRLLARLLGRTLESVAVLSLLRDPEAPPLVPEQPLGGPAEQPPGEVVAEVVAETVTEVGLGRVPLPRHLPPGRLEGPPHPLGRFGGGSGEPAPGR